MKLKIEASAQNGAIASVAGNIVEKGVQDFDFDFAEGELFYLFVGQGDGRVKGQSSAEYALEHIRDSFSMGDIASESIVDDMFSQCLYIHQQVNGVGAHLGEVEGHGCDINGIFGDNNQGYSLAAGGGRTYIYRDGTLSQISDPAMALGYGAEQDQADVWQIGGELIEGDTLLVVSKAVTEYLTNEDIEDILYLSNYPADHILAEAEQEGMSKNTPAAVVAAKVGGADFRELDPNYDYEQSDSKYDAWA
ncbi:MAG: hypothetical protein IIV68_00615 [Alistipes sp.]|nr:hypothetical protein [Alistipes sp.]